MTKYGYLLATATLAVGGLALLGCESNNRHDEETRTQRMSDVREEKTVEPSINGYMEIFDAGIGDSATETGGSVNAPD